MSQCLTPNPCDDYAGNDPLKCCRQLRERVEFLKNEIRELRALIAYGVPVQLPGPYEDEAAAIADGVVLGQAYLTEDGKVFVSVTP